MSAKTIPKFRSILVSPYKMDIIDNLAKSDNPLSKKELEIKMITKPAGLQDFLNKLKMEQVIFSQDNDHYMLTITGKEFYKKLKKIIREIGI